MNPASLLRVRRFEPLAAGPRLLVWLLSTGVTILNLAVIFTLAQAVETLAGSSQAASQQSPSLFPQLLQFGRWYARVDEPEVRLLLLVLLGLGLSVAAVVARSIVERIARWRAEGTAAALRAALRLQVRRLEGAEMLCGRSLAAVDFFTDGVEVLRQALVTWWVSIPLDFLLLLGLVAAALMVQPWIGLAAGLLVGLAMLTLASQESRSQEKQQAAAEQAQSLLKQLVEHVRQPRFVNGTLLDDVPGQPFAPLAEHYRQAALVEQASATVGRPFLAVITASSAALLFWMIGSNLLRSPPGIDPAGASVILAAIVCAYHPLRRLRGASVVAARSDDIAERLMSYLDRAPRIGEMPGASPAGPFHEEIEFDHVTLPDATGRKLLDDVSFRLPAGSRVAIVASDPDTPLAVACLLARYADPTRGVVRIDGRDIRLASLDSHRRNLALVLQHGLQFPGTVADNIACGDNSFTEPQLTEAMNSVQADELLKSLPNGLETLLGEHAASLGPADIFCIGAARAWLRRPLLVVMDELRSTSDPIADAATDRTLRALAQGRTAVLLAQRLTTLREIERVLVFHEGRLTGDGKHTDLIQSHPLYRHLVYVRFTPTDST